METAILELADSHEMDLTLGKALRTAYLLTASPARAESAVLRAMESWDLNDNREDSLFQEVLKAAVQDEHEDEPSRANEPQRPGWDLPAELKAVLRLSAALRRCFVLRILVGASRHACSGLLGLPSSLVDEYTGAALKVLPALAGGSG